MDTYLAWIFAGLGALTLGGVFWKMERGFGPFNLRAVVLVLITTIVALLALREGGALTAAMGVLGAIAGYLFGIKDSTAR